jgi:type III secretion protein W
MAMTSAIGPGDVERIIEKEEVQEVKVSQAAQEETENADMQTDLKDSVNPFALEKKKESIKEHLATRVQEVRKAEGALLLPVEEIDGAAEKFARNRQNPEIDEEKLAQLGKSIEQTDTKEKILEKVTTLYKDPFLASEALDFLMEMALHPSLRGTPIANTIKAARDEFTATFQQQIIAGRNIQKVTQAAVEEKLGSPEELRKDYYQFTLNEPDAHTLLEELLKDHGSDYKKISQHIKFLLSSLGADMKPVISKEMHVKHASLPRAQLQSLIKETRVCQAILGVYRFYSGRMPLVTKLFKKEGVEAPAQLTHENIAKQFMSLAADRAPSALKVAQLAPKLGIEDSVEAQIIVFSQMRDGVPSVSLLIFKSGPTRDDAIQRRNDVLVAIIDELENLEESLEVKLEEVAKKMELPAEEKAETKPLEKK